MLRINKEIKTLDLSKVTEAEIEKSAIEAQRRAMEWQRKKETGDLTDLEKLAIRNGKKLDEWLKTHDFLESNERGFAQMLIYKCNDLRYTILGKGGLLYGKDYVQKKNI